MTETIGFASKLPLGNGLVEPMKPLIRCLVPGLLALGIAMAGGCSGEKTIQAPSGAEGTTVDAKTRIAKDPRLKEDMEVVGQKKARRRR